MARDRHRRHWWRRTVTWLLAGLACASPRLAFAVCVGDCDGDGQVAINELVTGVNIALGNRPLADCPAFDEDGSGGVTINELIRAVNNALNDCPPEPTVTPPGPTTPSPTVPLPDVVSLLDSSPANGEGSVAITRETILRFDGPLDPTSVASDAVHANFGGQRLPGRLHVSPDGRRVTHFYDPPLPATARIRVTVDGDRLRDTRGLPVDADGDATPGGVAQVDFDTLNLVPFPGTHVCGRVFASNPAPAQTGEFVNAPLRGVRVSVDGMEDEIFAVTDQNGDFRLENVPAGVFFVHIDGLLATTTVPPGAYYPRVGKMWESVPGEETNIGEIYLPLIPPNSLVDVSATADTAITVTPAVLQQFPQLDGVRITVPADSLYREDGGRGAQVGIAGVEPDRLPAPLPPGLDPDLIITVQAFGGTDFDTPVAVCFPNTEGLARGGKSALISFNHDTGRWEVRGSMTV